mmetsp:Transcript_1066/g.1611  ORF Transcript_1066/g.1611 Transcript_1066/m.1611 type:complete len:313 (-) Transcript_1066:43-981(-)|eukprot:CAMPEP_0171458932 /NCGR_PEP_ID=MMETSP0945-20130129/4414_1 /TAXON_ID=109269 /ORGANISM="Vaucheria litorea, Strain CCMP2940" /LENGTH=312 /DNA_ID=CAMNT_0011984841 /DNA_START=15 /DNA_END=953 /DNA_ORIENTATION=-
MEEISISSNHHGKENVRIVKVVRKVEKHFFYQFTVDINLFGPVKSSFEDGDNSVVIPTDTQKNTVYIIAKTNSFESCEEFGQLIASHFLKTYPKLVEKCHIFVKQDIWERIVCKSSTGKQMEHNHAFKKIGPHINYATVIAFKGAQGPKFEVFGGCKGLTLLKTTKSSFVNFHKDRFTTLSEDNDRLVGSNFDSEWAYNSSIEKSEPKFNYNSVRSQIMLLLEETFAGPADIGEMSVSVQATAYKMGSLVLSKVQGIDSIKLRMPNVHNLPVDMSRFGLSKFDHTGSPDIYLPIDDPHGIIQVTMVRPKSKL